MTPEAFDKLVDDALAGTREVLVSKAAEYASPDDRLHNFKKGAAILRCTPAQTCLSYLTKHLASIVDIVERYDERGTLCSREMLDEKFGDAINYLLLLKACLLDE